MSVGAATLVITSYAWTVANREAWAEGRCSRAALRGYVCLEGLMQLPDAVGSDHHEQQGGSGFSYGRCCEQYMPEMVENGKLAEVALNNFHAMVQSASVNDSHLRNNTVLWMPEDLGEDAFLRQLTMS